jgi:hypothetical protein
MHHGGRNARQGELLSTGIEDFPHGSPTRTAGIAAKELFVEHHHGRAAPTAYEAARY